jgi:hypothetical protein
MHKLEFEGRVYDDRHGGPFDRGAADSYYRRGRRPHFFTDATYMSEEIEERFMTKAQILEYNAGYEYNELSGSFKDWG